LASKQDEVFFKGLKEKDSKILLSLYHTIIATVNFSTVEEEEEWKNTTREEKNYRKKKKLIPKALLCSGNFILEILFEKTYFEIYFTCFEN